MARRALACLALLALAADQALVASMPSALSTRVLAVAFSAGLVAAAAGVLLRFALARWVALGASFAGLTQAAIASGWWLSFDHNPPLALVAVGATCAVVLLSLWGRRMALHHDRGLRSALWRAEGSAPRWLAAAVIGAAAAVPMLLVYAHLGPWWLSDAHRVVAWSLAVGFTAAAALIALERTAGVLMLAPLGLMTIALVLDAGLWLVAAGHLGPLGGTAAITSATLVPVLGGATATLGAAARFARPVARFLAAAR